MKKDLLVAGATALLVASAAQAHHSYAMFDPKRPTLIEGTVAKLEWRNPHTFLWIYASKPGKPGKPGEYELWSFENGSVSLLSKLGWRKDGFRTGEPVIVQYFPLRDGRNGGYLLRVVRADGSELHGDRYVPGAEAVLDAGPLNVRPGATAGEAAR